MNLTATVLVSSILTITIYQTPRFFWLESNEILRSLSKTQILTHRPARPEILLLTISRHCRGSHWGIKTKAQAVYITGTYPHSCTDSRVHRLYRFQSCTLQWDQHTGSPWQDWHHSCIPATGATCGCVHWCCRWQSRVGWDQDNTACKT